MRSYTVTNISPTSSYTFHTGMPDTTLASFEHVTLKPGETREVILDGDVTRALIRQGLLLVPGDEVPTKPNNRVKVLDAKRNRVLVPARRFMGHA